MSTQTEIPAPAAPEEAPAAEAPAAETTPAPATPEPAPAAPARRNKPLLIAIGVVLAALIGAGVYLGVVRDDQPASGDRLAAAKSDPANAFKVVLPEGWRSATKEELAQAPGSPLAVLRRDDGRGFVVIRRSGRIPENLATFTKDLDAQLKRRFDDFQRQTAKVVKVRAGSAYNYLYIRKKEGTVQTITIVPADRGSFTLNGIAEGGDDKVAREIARVIASFDA